MPTKPSRRRVASDPITSILVACRRCGTWSHQRRASIAIAGALVVLVATAAVAYSIYDEFRSPPLGARPIPRSEWARQTGDPNDMAPMQTIERITIHHEGGGPVRFTGYSATARRLEAIRAYHRDGRGWADIAYHLVIDRAGRLWEGRKLEYQGAHAGNDALNRHNLGILVLGDFNEQDPTSAQLDCLEKTLASEMSEHHVPVSEIYLHRELTSTDCPGERLTAWFDDWRRQFGSLVQRTTDDETVTGASLKTRQRPRDQARRRARDARRDRFRR